MDGQKQYWPLDKLENWDKNPRTITEADTARLKKQLINLGQYKPLIIVPTLEGRAVVLGGNMRLGALRELVADGHTEFANVWVSPVDAPDDKRKLEYALSDNDRAGQYQEDELVTLMREAGDGLSLEDYHIDTAYHIGLDTLGDRYDMADTRSRGYGAGTADKSKVKDAKKIFDNATIKQIVLYFANAPYEWMLDMLERICEEQGLESNTEAVEWMTKEYEKDHPKQDA